MAQFTPDLEQVVLAYEYEEQFAAHERPLVLDAGSAFTDKYGNVHTDACGWLAIHAAFHLLYSLGKLKSEHATMLINGQLRPEHLKLMLNWITDKNVRITDDDIDAIGIKLNLKIVVHEPGHQTARKYGKIRNAYQLHLYYFRAHYYVPIDKYDINIVEEHVDTWGNRLNYTVMNLGDLCNISTDAKLAREIADEDLAREIADEDIRALENDDTLLQITCDAQIARELQDQFDNETK